MACRTATKAVVLGSGKPGSMAVALNKHRLVHELHMVKQRTRAQATRVDLASRDTLQGPKCELEASQMDISTSADIFSLAFQTSALQELLVITKDDDSLH